MRTRHVNRQCGPRGPNTGSATSDEQKVINKEHFEQRAARTADQEMVRAVLQAWLMMPLPEVDCG